VQKVPLGIDQLPFSAFVFSLQMSYCVPPFAIQFTIFIGSAPPKCGFYYATLGCNCTLHMIFHAFLLYFSI
ncbi:MAG: hypothetical protein K2N00_09760, partial [Lachnospiraceae bacterium]|nr:hypothetical protein [Lachnospiraceae bacterium]